MPAARRSLRIARPARVRPAPESEVLGEAGDARPGAPRSSGSREARRDRILDEAERLFAEVGFSATSMRDIAEAAGANVASLYYHCGDKEALFGLIYARLIRRVGGLVAEEMAASPTNFSELVARVVDRVVEFFARNPRAPRLLLRL